jgi:hypothetical protein
MKAYILFCDDGRKSQVFHNLRRLKTQAKEKNATGTIRAIYADWFKEANGGFGWDYETFRVLSQVVCRV